MAFKRLYHSVMCARAALYSAFGSPSFGITWSLVTFLSGLLYLIYDDHKRHAPPLQGKKRVPELE
ncbi:MAG TPA: hypothetical protein VFU31_21900 [Candidatus Binatia bacterium]|nr:hypothetical protein [Candidatus Binatia bacterium]